MPNFIHSLGWFGVFIFPFIESIGFPMPTAFAFLAAIAVLEVQGATGWTVFAVIGVLVLSQMGGSIIGYFLGLRGSSWVGKKIASSPKFKNAYETLERFYARWGVPTVIIGRMCGYVRPWTSLASGLMKMRTFPFLVATFVGSTLWSLMTLWLIHAGYKAYERGGVGRILVFAVLAVALMMLVAFWARPRRGGKA